MEQLNVVIDVTYRIQIDDVSNGQGKEFRASVYDQENDLDLVTEGWGDTPLEAMAEAFITLQREEEN